jgi:hypothetical protein
MFPTVTRSLGWILAVAALGATTAAVPAATLTAVPMQGGMVMPMIAYHADHGALHVMVDPAVPQLTPLLVSNPGDGFATGDPWYDDLDPSRKGLAFSRRYGFVMEAGTDPLPVTLSIWLRRISGPPELGIYRYQNSAPKAWEPIFGTAGSPDALRWNGMMFHPAFTAPPGTNSLTATFEAYLVENATGQPVAGSSTGPFQFHWTVVPDGRPTLAIASKIVISWPASTPTGILESADSLASSEWTVVPQTPVVVDGQPTVILGPEAAGRFFRLRLNP